MRIHPECLSCLTNTAVEQAKLATDDEELQTRAIFKFLKFLTEKFSRENTPPYYGSERSRIVKEVTSESDLYAEAKEEANMTGGRLEPHAKSLVEESNDRSERLRRAIKIVAAANSMEFGVSGYEFNPDNFKAEFEELLDQKLQTDDSDRIASKILSSDEILYLTDNCGEIFLDRVLMEEINEAGTTLIVGAKSGPIQEDVTVKMLEEMGIRELGKIIPVGEKVGIFWEDAHPQLREILRSSDLIISKGMGNFETISEFDDRLKGRLAYLLRAKCNPVAQTLGVERGELVIKLI